LFLVPGSAFFVKQENYFTINAEASFPRKFVEKIEIAVERIKDKKNPILVVDLSANCDPNGLARSKVVTRHKDVISYDALLDKLFKSSFSENKHITLMLFVDACSSGLIIPKIKEKLSCSDDEKQECRYIGLDGNKYKYKISIYTASNNNGTQKSEFLESLNFISKLEDGKNQKGYGLNNSGILTFLSLDKVNNHSFWSSFSGINEKLSSKGEMSVIIKLLNSDNPEYRDAAFATLVAKASNATEKEAVISALVEVLKNEESSDWANLRASAILIDVAQRNKMVIDTLVEIIKDRKTGEKRRSNAISTLGFMAKGNEMVIGTFVDVVEIDRNDRKTMEDKFYAIVVLGEIAQGDINAISALEKFIQDQKENKDVQQEDKFNKLIQQAADEALNKIKQP